MFIQIILAISAIAVTGIAFGMRGKMRGLATFFLGGLISIMAAVIFAPTQPSKIVLIVGGVIIFLHGVLATQGLGKNFGTFLRFFVLSCLVLGGYLSLQNGISLVALPLCLTWLLTTGEFLNKADKADKDYESI